MFDVPNYSRRVGFAFTAAGFVLACMAVTDRQFANAHCRSIVDFELVLADPGRTTAMIDSWTEREKVFVGFSIGLDYLFMPAYATAIASLCMWRGRGSAMAKAAAWAVWLAAAFDCAENFGLLMLVTGGSNALWAMPTFFCVCAKFGLLAAGVIYSLFCRLLGGGDGVGGGDDKNK